MTIAAFITLEQRVALLGELTGERLEGRLWCSEVVYAVPDAAFHVTERSAWPLGPRGEGPGAEGVAVVTA